MNQDGLDIRHEPETSRFIAIVEGLACHADYRLDGGVMTVFHTEVPRVLEGRGIAGRLVDALFAHARTRGLRVRPTCSYVRAWARRHPEVGSLLTD
ncbi:MAG: hypothetical protein RIS35_322 [Pseudomonadota bacterium]|jgi:predicted GNAT family acetyltransferase